MASPSSSLMYNESKEYKFSETCAINFSLYIKYFGLIFIQAKFVSSKSSSNSLKTLSLSSNANKSEIPLVYSVLSSARGKYQLVDVFYYEYNAHGTILDQQQNPGEQTMNQSKLSLSRQAAEFQRENMLRCYHLVDSAVDAIDYMKFVNRML